MTVSPKKWESPGGPVPLFDRLVDLEPEIPEEPVPFLNYNKQQLIESVIREASNLLNTRCKISYKLYEELEPSSLTYGIPDLYGLFDASYADPSRSEDRIKLSRFIANALQMFDSRLDNILVDIDRYDQPNQTAHLTISANLKIGKTVEAISFPVSMENR
jgi:type VI secretion system lysozyme-like protein